MKLTDQLANGLKGNLGFLQMHLGDFSDAELMVRPVEGANHANWQLGHLLMSETNMMKMVGAVMPELPAGVAEKYSKATSKSDEAGAFLKKEELVGLLGKARAASVSFAAGLTDAQLEMPGPEKLRAMVATVADLLALLSVHTAMHVGQIQVIRRKLGKPVLF